MQTISFKDAMFRARFTEHGRALLDVVERQPGIALETLIREHDPAPAKLIGAVYAHFAELVKENLTSPVAALEPKDAIGRFPAGGHAVKQLCEAGALVITKRLRVYRPQDLPPRDLSARSDGASSDDSRESEGTPPKESTERRRASA